MGDVAPPENEDADPEATLIHVYRKCVEKYGWSLKDIDETNLETLFDFVLYKEKPDPNIRTINGKTYRRATKPPSWL